MFLLRPVLSLIAITLLSGSLAGCGSISSFLAGSMGDFIPTWAGGLPADAPPRPGTAKYNELMRQRERQQLEPAAKSDAAKASESSSANAIH